jgi:sugar O-acyltransferase (sialic acid O-acetyltransferase NeuD family)
MKIGIIGYGSFGKQIQNYLRCENNKLKYLVFDDTITDQNIYPFENYIEFIDNEFLNEFYIGLGYKNLTYKNKIIDNIPAKKLPYFIHDTVYCNKTSEIGCGTFIFPNVSIDSCVKIGRGVVLNISTVVCHDSVIGDCCFFAPSVTICGNVNVGKNCFIGAGSIITNGITIGDNVMIGAGTIVTNNIQSNERIIGNPMRKVKKITLN